MHYATVYYRLTKPGIVYGNTLTAAAGFFLASHGIINWLLLLATLVGISCVMASACVCNNYIDRDIDARMERTRDRALADGRISTRSALIFAAILLLLGSMVLFLFSNMTALSVALVGFVVYVALYSPLKHHSGYALYVGAIAGATPPVVGYVAVTNMLDATALALFIFLCLWQVPHFLAIAYYRFDEYAAAGIPLLVKKRPTEPQRRVARIIFYLSLVVLLAWCVILMVQR